MTDELLKVADAALMLNCSTSQVRTLIRSGKLDAVNLSIGTGRPNYRIQESTIRRFLKDRSTRSQSVASGRLQFRHDAALGRVKRFI